MQSRLKKNIRAEVIKIIWFRIKKIIYKKTETCTPTILKNWQLQNWMKNKRKKKNKNMHLHTSFNFYSKSKKTQGKFSLKMII